MAQRGNSYPESPHLACLGATRGGLPREGVGSRGNSGAASTIRPGRRGQAAGRGRRDLHCACRGAAVGGLRSHDGFARDVCIDPRGSRSRFRWSGKEKTGRCASTARCRRLRPRTPARASTGWRRPRQARRRLPRGRQPQPAARHRMSPRRQSSRPKCVLRSRAFDGMAAAAEDHWLWQSIFAPAEIHVPVQAPHAAPGEAMLRVRLVANSSRPSILTTTSSSRSTAPRLQTKSGMASALV